MTIAPSDWTAQDVEDLEPNAWEVVRSQRNYSVIAGPGAGKTELLAQRACYLLQTGQCINPKRILALSFKKDAAENLRERVGMRCQSELARRFDSYTYDAFAKSLVDRFSQSLPRWCRPDVDYRIIFPRTRDYRDFLGRPPVAPPDDVGGYNALQTIPHFSFERDFIAGALLPVDGFDPTNIGEWATRLWWETYIQLHTPSQLSFSMIGRLAELLLRVNPKITRALQLTYSHVFLDEFQDTTHVQYALLGTAFFDSDSILTAVGDNKQQIMRWAMALPDPFGDLEHDIDIVRLPLTFNYRSSPELVQIQHRIARNIDPDAHEAESRSANTVDGDVCAILDFSGPTREAQYIADLVRDGVEQHDLSPRDFVVLVRQKPADYLDDLAPAFSGEIGIRNESEIQDLIKERLVSVLLAYLRLGSVKRAGAAWIKCRDIKSILDGVDPEDKQQYQHLVNQLQAFQLSLYSEMQEGPTSAEDVEKVTEKILDFLSVSRLVLTYPEYQHQPNFDRVLSEFREQVVTRVDEFGDWSSLLDDLEGLTSVPLMTVHKSKGLEYHTVIFVGLDDAAWWSFRREPDEGRSTFFVAFSRAEQRVLFTFCEQRHGDRGRRHEIASLYELLTASGVPQYHIGTQLR